MHSWLQDRKSLKCVDNDPDFIINCLFSSFTCLEYGVSHCAKMSVIFEASLIFAVVVPMSWLQVFGEFHYFLCVVNASLFIAIPV